MKHHHDARYPLLWMTTTEEERAIRENRAKFPDDVPFFSWDLVQGFQALTTNGDGKRWVWKPAGDKILNPQKALEAVAGLPPESVIWMKDFHKFFESIAVARQALAVKSDLKADGKSIVFLSAETKIPLELKNDITPLDFAYPDAAALEKILAKMCEDNERDMPPDKDRIINAMRGLTSEGAENALALCLAMKGNFDVRTILDQKAAQLKAGGVLQYGRFTETLKGLYGLDVMKDFSLRTIDSPKARGILVYGVPGTGKSHFAKAMANETGRPCLIAKMSALRDKYQGMAEAKLQDMFRTIDAFGKCVVFIDEMEKMIAGTGSAETDGGVGQRLFGDLLSYMEDHRGTGAYWIATCNSLDDILHLSGGALMRRFDAIFFCDMPTPEEACGIAKIWSGLEGVEIPQGFDLSGYSGADIASLAQKMSMLNAPTEEAAEFVLPYGKANADELSRIRTAAQGVCIWASRKPVPAGSAPAKRKVRVAG